MRVKYPILVIAGAVAVCLPMVPGILNGDVEPMAAGIRFAVALVACWAFAAVLTWVVGTYAEQSRRSELRRAIEDVQRSPGEPLAPSPEQSR